MKWARRIFVIILVFPLLFFGILLGIRYINYLRDKNPNKTLLLPRIELSTIQITSLTDEQTDLVVKMLVKNPLPINIRIDSMQYRIFIGDTEIVKSTYKDSVFLKSKDSCRIDFPATIHNQQYFSVVKKENQKNKDSVIYELAISFYSNYSLGKKINIRLKKLLPLIHIPIVKVEKTELDSLSFSGANLLLHTAITNNNVFDLEAKEVKYRFALGKNKWLEGSSKHIFVRKKSSTEIIFPIKLSFKEMDKALFQLTKGKNLDYRMELEFKIVSDENFIRDSKVKIISNGTIGQIEKIIEKEKEKAKKKKRNLSDQIPFHEKKLIYFTSTFFEAFSGAPGFLGTTRFKTPFS